MIARIRLVDGDHVSSTPMISTMPGSAGAK